MINKTCFPVNYSESFYKNVVQSKNENLNKFAYHNGFVVGAICTRIESLPKVDDDSGGNGSNGSNDGKRIYIMTLGVLAAYRNRGIGQKLVQSIIDYYEECKTAATTKNDRHDSNENNNSSSTVLIKEDIAQMKSVKEVALHVQISNHDALKFYKEKFGFEQGEQVDNYYKRIDPPHCYVLRKRFC